MQASEMTLEQCLGWLAVDIQQQKLRALGIIARSEDYYVEPEPIPATLDAAAAAMPERFTQSIEQYETGWTAKAMSWDCTLNTGVIEADTELLARFRLAVACRMAMKGATNAH